MNIQQCAKATAEKSAQIDKALGFDCNPARHNAMPGSAWAKWYIDEYNRPTTGEDNHE